MMALVESIMHNLCLSFLKNSENQIEF